MDSSLIKTTPNSKPLLTSSIRNTPDSCITTPGIAKTLLTPCRRMGLKRKSMKSVKCKLHKNEVFVSKSPNINNSVIKSNKNSSLSVDIDSEKIETVVSKTNVPDIGKDEMLREVSDNKVDKELCVKPKFGAGYNCVPGEMYDKVINESQNITLEMLELLVNRVKEKKEKLQRVKLSELYDKKHDLKVLKELTSKWKQGCQEALYEMQSLLRDRGHNISMSQLLTQCQIPSDIVNFNEDIDDFE